MGGPKRNPMRSRCVVDSRKALDIAHGIYQTLCCAPGERMAVIVNAENEVDTKPDWSAVVRKAERDHPERIAGYYETARNLRAKNITPQGIADDIMAVVSRA